MPVFSVVLGNTESAMYSADGGPSWGNFDDDLAEWVAGQVFIGVGRVGERVHVVDNRRDVVLVKKHVHPLERRAMAHRDSPNGG